jgi:hypothetical protein
VVNAQYWLGLRQLAEVIGLGEQVVRFRVDLEWNRLVVEVNDPDMPEVPDGRCVPIVGQVQPSIYVGDYDPDRVAWEFAIEKDAKLP